MEDIYSICGVLSSLLMIVYCIYRAVDCGSGARLQNKFANLTKDSGGIIAGKNYDEIVDACGAPSAVSATAGGGKLCQWMETGYHIALLFDADGVCIGVQHEAAI